MGAVALAGLAGPVAASQARGRIVVVGGGFGGVACARTLRRIAPELEVFLIEPDEAFVTCPFSNAVIGGLDSIESITHGFDRLRRAGVEVVRARVEAVDPDSKEVRLTGRESLSYDRLVMSPGIGFKWGAIDGYDAAAAERIPHAWKAGPQTLLLRRQLEAMDDGGVVVMAVPNTPYRCPPGPYERASLIAHYLKHHKPRSKVLLLDAKDVFSKQPLFEEAWSALFGDMLERVPFGTGGNVTRVDPAQMTLYSEFHAFRADVANVIPPQRAADIVVATGLTEGDDWAVVDPRTFESLVVPGIHVLGDSIIAGAMPKSGFSAASQAMACARAIAALQSDNPLPEASFVNTCYSLVAPDYGISVVDVFRIGADGTIVAVEGAGGISPLGADARFRELEAEYARGWYASMMADLFG